MCLLAASSEQDRCDPDDDRNRSIDRPLRVTRHKTAGQDVNSLQDPDRTSEDQQGTDDIQADLHNKYLLWTDVRDYISFVDNNPLLSDLWPDSPKAALSAPKHDTI